MRWAEVKGIPVVATVTPVKDSRFLDHPELKAAAK